MNDNVLTERAAGLGIDAGFYDINGMYRATKPEVMEATVHTLQQNHVLDGLSSDNLYDDTVTLHEFRQERVSVPAGSLDAQAVMVRTEGGETLPARLCEENGSAWVLLPELPCGYHNLSVHGDGKSYQVMLIVAPGTVYRPAGLSDGLRMNGLTVQLYGLRSRRNWGIGDFTDLAQLMEYTGERGLEFVGINPSYALFTPQPAFASPYSSSSRSRLNPAYLGVEQVGAFSYSGKARKQLNRSTLKERLAALRLIDTVAYALVWELKRDVLQITFDAFEQDDSVQAQLDRATFQDFVAREGSDLYGFGLFEALDQHYDKTDAVGWTV